MADYRISHPKEIVQEGDEVQVRIIRIDPQHRRIGLSLRQASDEAYVEVDWQEEARWTPSPTMEEVAGQRRFRRRTELQEAERTGAVPNGADARRALRPDFISGLGAPSTESLRCVYAEGSPERGLRHPLSHMLYSFVTGATSVR